MRGLYAGAVPALVANVGENAILFVAYEQCKKLVSLTKTRLIGSSAELGPLENALAGSGAAVFSAMWLCPTEHVKCQLQVRRELSKVDPAIGAVTPFTLLREILNRGGAKELFRGLKPTWARELPGYFCFFGGYEASRTVICKVTNVRYIPLQSATECRRLNGFFHTPLISTYK